MGKGGDRSPPFHAVGEPTATASRRSGASRSTSFVSTCEPSTSVRSTCEPSTCEPSTCERCSSSVRSTCEPWTCAPCSCERSTSEPCSCERCSSSVRSTCEPWTSSRSTSERSTSEPSTYGRSTSERCSCERCSSSVQPWTCEPSTSLRSISSSRETSVTSFLQVSRRHPFQASTLSFAHPAPHAVSLITAQGVVEALDPHRAIGADPFRLSRRAPLLREEDLGVVFSASRSFLPWDVVMHRALPPESHACDSETSVPSLTRGNLEIRSTSSCVPHANRIGMLARLQGVSGGKSVVNSLDHYGQVR
jgi:hypothetical protein